MGGAEFSQNIFIQRGIISFPPDVPRFLPVYFSGLSFTVVLTSLKLFVKKISLLNLLNLLTFSNMKKLAPASKDSSPDSVNRL